MCRFCAQESDQKFSIYTQTLTSPSPRSEDGSTKSDLSYSDVASKYLGLKLDVESPYPQFSCLSCTQMIQNLLEFFHLLEIGQSKLTELLIDEGSLELKKRGRPKKGCEKNVKLGKSSYLPSARSALLFSSLIPIIDSNNIFGEL